MKLFLGAIGGEVTAELPFVLMHPKPDMRRMIKVYRQISASGTVLNLEGDPNFQKGDQKET